MSILRTWLPDSPRLRISLFGHIAIELDNQPIVKVPGQKIAALLAYLVCNPGTHSREHLADLLWDDIPHDRFLPNLRSTLNRLPKFFKPYLATTRDTVAFAANAQNHLQEDVWVDVLAFQELADCLPNRESRHSDEYIDQLNTIEEQLVTMLGHYKGPFLDGLLLNDAPRFSDWQLIQREHLARLALDGLRNLVELTMRQGRYIDGIAYARQMIELDPLDEEARRQLMIMLARTGEQQAALQVYQALVEMLDEEFYAPPAPETVAAHAQITAADEPDSSTSSTLPTFIPPAIGRQTEISALIHQLQMPDCRLVTVTGLGGTGKTYLAVEAAKMLEKSRDFLQGVAYVPLAGLESSDRIPEAIVQTLDLVLSEQGDLMDQICNYLEAKEMLIVLDNFDHLLETPNRETGQSSVNQNQAPPRTHSEGKNLRIHSGVKVLSQILLSAPQVKILATSRQPLQLQLEYLFPLGGMRLPDENSTLSLPDLMQVDAIRLFQQVALRNNPTFEVTEKNQQSVLQFCRLVQGTPLAIVLGAAHMDFLMPDDLVDECQESLDLLETEWADLPERQRSVRAIFEYSWQRLDEPLRQVFQKLTVFRGFTTKAARQVVGASPIQLRRLHSQSLIIQTDKGRYQIHELLRQFGAEKLAEQPEYASARQSESVQDRHMQFYLAWLSEQTAALRGNRPFEVAAEINLDLDNIRQAWNHAIEQQAVMLLAKSYEGLVSFYNFQGLNQEGLDVFIYATQIFQPHIQQEPKTEKDIQYLETYGLLVASHSLFSRHIGNFDLAIQYAEAAIGHANSLPQERVRKYEIQILSYRTWGSILLDQSDLPTAYAKINQALALAQHILDQYWIAVCLCVRGNIQMFNHQYEKAIEDTQQALDLSIQTQNSQNETECLLVLGDIKWWTSEEQSAKDYFEKALLISTSINDKQGEHTAHTYLSKIAIRIGEYSAAERYNLQSLHFWKDMGNKIMMGKAHFQLGRLYNRMGLYSAANYHLEQSLRISRALGMRQVEVIALHELGVMEKGLGNYEATLTFLEGSTKIANELGSDYLLHGGIFTDTAHTWHQLGQLSKSVEFYKRALAIYPSTLEHFRIHALAGLAYVLQQTGDKATAVSYIEDVLSYLAMNPEKVYLVREPFQSYLNCYHVLDAQQDPRALSILDAGYALLQTYASRIENEEHRRSFLENVPANREIVRLKEEGMTR